MKPILILSLLFTSVLSYSQTWAPPGANWHYSFFGVFNSTGYVKITYVSDTIIASQSVKKFEKYYHSYNYWNNQYYSGVFGHEYMHDDNGVVYVWFNNNWDTLYNFNASPGDSWTYAKEANHPWCNQENYLIVLDTGTININNHLLKFLVVQFYTDGLPSQPMDTLFEKIGFKNFYMFPHDICDGAFDVNEGGGLRCYSDNNFPLYKNPSFPENCDFIVGLDELIASVTFKIYPNPFKENFTIKTSDPLKNAVIKLSDVFGRQLLQREIIKSEITIDRTNLPSGIYFYQISSENKIISTGKIIAE